jgi:3-oxoacyl-[acyl-carrier-protein] synthase II
MSHDGHHVTSIDPNLDHVLACFADALANAGTPASAVRYLNAHGPGTAQCDLAEATALERFLPPDTGVFSVKPLVGHCQGAASAVEVAASALGYDRGLIPAPRTVAPGHPQLIDGHEKVTGGVTVKSSLGMGGHNSVVVLAPPA